MPITDYQLEIEDLVLGAGTAYEIQPEGLEGLGLPPVRTSDVPRPQDHGTFLGSDYLAEKTLTFEVSLLGDTEAEATALMDALSAVWQPPEGQEATLPLTLRLPGQTARRYNGRPRRLAYQVRDLKAGIVQAVLQYVAGDPRLYDDTETVLSTGAATAGGGRTYNRVYPLVYAAGGAGGNIPAVNTGNFPARPLLRITGPSNTPKVENIEAGQYLQVNLTLAAGEFLDIDLDARTVLLGGTASRYSSLASGSSWWELPPGTSTLKFTAADSMGTLEVRYRSAWML